ncbi:hypothetical protein [Lactococcus lactis]|nr:hypothetical protein [Lactococcus lactis]WDA67652.1 hypothetical protein IL310_08800 [Lactococcus lactis]
MSNINEKTINDILVKHGIDNSEELAQALKEILDKALTVNIRL